MGLHIRRRSRWQLAGAALVCVLAAAGPGAGTAAATAPLRGATNPAAIANRYIVVLHDGTSAARADAAQRRARAQGADVRHTYRRALRGFSARLSDRALAAVRDDPAVAYVEADARVTGAGTEVAQAWGLDRIDQRNLPLDTSYTFDVTGAGVTAYVVDSGVRASHEQFGGRVAAGLDTIDGGPPDDCHGHGTHVAGTLGGASYGVAKAVSIVAVRVLGCTNQGFVSQFIAGIDWVTGDHAAGEPAVANLSLAANEPSAALDEAVQTSISDGITYAVAAGNSAADACDASPARVPSALTVGATTAADTRAGFSNHGRCLDLYAPGLGIKSAWYTSDTATATAGGTSMAAPHVAGAAALVLERTPAATPATVALTLADAASIGKVADPSGMATRLLYAPPAAKAAPAPALAAPAGATLGDGAALSATVTIGGRVDPVAGGTVDLRLYGPADTGCAGPPLLQSLDMPYPPDATAVVSPPYTPVDAGIHRWRATYSGDDNNRSAASVCGAPGTITAVAAATPALAATASPGFELGSGTATDTVTLTGRVHPLFGASIEFELHGPDDPTCTGAPVFQSVHSVALGWEVRVSSGAFAPTLPGTHRWIARYLGDANNQPVSSACDEPGQSVTVTPLPPSTPDAPPAPPPPPGASVPPPPAGAPASPPAGPSLPARTCQRRRATHVARSGGRPVRGTARADVIAGTDGRDRLDGRGGNDVICAGRGADVVTGGAGADRIRTVDGSADRVDCGPGRDRIVADRSDRLKRCEIVSRTTAKRAR